MKKPAVEVGDVWKVAVRTGCEAPDAVNLIERKLVCDCGRAGAFFSRSDDSVTADGTGLVFKRFGVLRYRKAALGQVVAVAGKGRLWRR